jgi:hypothetical protein
MSAMAVKVCDRSPDSVPVILEKCGGFRYLGHREFDILQLA